MAENSFRALAVRILNWLRKPAGLIVAVLLFLLIPVLLRYLNRQPLVLPVPQTERALGIREFINNLKAEMAKLEEERINSNEAAAFNITGYDLEISFIVRTNAQQKAGVEYQIVTAESQIQQGMERVQKLTLHLKPRGPEEVPTNRVDSLSKDNLGPILHEDLTPQKKE